MKHPFGLEAFVDWLETQPPAGIYNYRDNNSCAYALYLQSIGISASVGAYQWHRDDTLEEFDLPNEINETVRGSKAQWTFGAAARRGRQFLESVS